MNGTSYSIATMVLLLVTMKIITLLRFQHFNGLRVARWTISHIQDLLFDALLSAENLLKK